MLYFYNTLSKSKEKFTPINPGKVGMYVCGPTVYDYIHIGNLKSYATSDTLRRYLEYLGFEVRQIKNITDVGHLTEDDIAQADSGEDKITKKALQEKKTPHEIAEFYEDYFHAVEKEMNILPAHYFPKATAHIPQMIKIISALIKKGNAYEKNGNVFFDVTTFSDYGKLSGNTLENLKVGARLEEHPDKKNPWDFALWLKASKEHLLKWESPWSLGYPGWHIECSAMSVEYLGDTIDIHTGGEDNIFPHHESEIAQSEAATGKKFVNYWFHPRFLKIEGEKMSKSLKNFYTLADIEKRGISPLALRYLFLTGHYRSQFNFTWDGLNAAQSALYKLYENTSLLKTSSGKVDKNYKAKFLQALNDDLNMPKAISIVWQLVKDKKINEGDKRKTLLDFDKVLGLNLAKIKKVIIPPRVKKLIAQREIFRKRQNWKAADEVRIEIQKLGYRLDDTKEGTRISAISR